MTIEAPRLDERSAEQITTQVEQALERADHGWQHQEGGAGWALVQLFGRLAELVVKRLNQVPEKHFLAFLDEAGVDLLPSRPASTELTFTPAEDGPPFVRVPAGTQVATIQTETQPEVVFETQQDLVVAPSTLVGCIALDPLSISDRAAQAAGPGPGSPAAPSTTPGTGAPGTSFAAFQGDRGRKRVLYLGDDELFTFADATSRQAAKIRLSFEFAIPGNPAADGWRLEWLYWDGTDWASMVHAGAIVDDGTHTFDRDGDVELTHLPELTETTVGGESGLWIACQLTGGTARNHLPVLTSIKRSRSITDLSGQGTADTAFSAIQSGTAFVPLDPAGEFFPLGQHPGRLDTFYLQADEAFSKRGATITLQMDLVGVQTPQNTSELEKLKVEWQYHSQDGWVSLGISTYNAGVTSPQLDFEDTTNGFTANGSQHVTFRVPEPGEVVPPFEETTVNDQAGYWLRARVLAGSYDEPGELKQVGVKKQWVPPQTHAPVISNLKVGYSGYSEPESAATAITRCCSYVDGTWRDHGAFGERFSPFAAAEEGLAFYLGFQPAFPPGEWMQLLLDVEERIGTSGARPIVFWEYWNGSRWTSLQTSDGSQGLSKRGYLGFFAPDDHSSSTEFGQDDYWLRARPHLPPLANAGHDRDILVEGEEVTVTLDASRSRAFDRQRAIAQYKWRLVPPDSPTADPGQDRSVPTPGSEATAIATPRLKAVRPNTVPALNAVTIREEALGSSDGKPGQVLTLVRSPVLPGAQIAVREPDHPPEEELEQLQQELQRVEETARALVPGPEAALGEGVWVRWHQVSDFHASTSASRHFTLDPISGQVRFGDGKRGRIPLAGRDNIKAVLYRTHDGAQGNAAAGTITVLRNPSGDLADVKGVTNPEAAAGGSDAETVDEVKQRGPQAIKHRDRAVTVGGFAWLAQEVSDEVAQARCLPACNPLGLPEPGWVTVAITPESTAAKPTPAPALIRRVQAHLANHALVNLRKTNQVHVRGPDYVEATVLARVVPSEPVQADEVKLAVLARLERFLHPLCGGPERSGWELDREVYLSEIYAEIEAVPGVDHVVEIRLLGSLQQARLRLQEEAEGYREVPFDLPVGSQVSTFDERIKLRLAEPVLKKEGQDKELRQLAIYGFNVGDRVAIVAADNAILKDNLHIASRSGDRITFDQSFEPHPDWEVRDVAIMSSDGHLRLPLAEDGFTVVPDRVTVTVRGLKAGDKVSVVVGTWRDPALEFLPIEEIRPCEDRIFVPEGHLVCSGDHDIEMVLE
jgi:hypothetical protein